MRRSKYLTAGKLLCLQQTRVVGGFDVRICAVDLRYRWEVRTLELSVQIRYVAALLLWYYLRRFGVWVSCFSFPVAGLAVFLVRTCMCCITAMFHIMWVASCDALAAGK